ncbi:mediator of RNA polymerase II transcription subunit 33B-like isoform X3 [Trifolium pratense]|uniref:mediator of RNA polymerase II transcription subunit 33B-like isoform X3 n=1 Tax=Trifolium pratense TaxID=57577 RepID=UPI001E693E2C|nr:mediator of RNA polymerase II transcription subunit 33B-like isoform X3 [Trifolium pratense]
MVSWERVIEITKWSQEKKTEAVVWSIEVSSCLNTAGVSLPSVELAHRLVTHICWENNVPATWKYLEKAMEVRMVPPFLVLALLSTKVVPNRHPVLHPAAYSLYLHLLNRHAFSLSSLVNSPNYPSLMNSIHHVLSLSQLYDDYHHDVPSHPHPGVALVQFLFTLVWQLLQASLQDEGLLQRHKSLLFVDPGLDLTIEKLDNPHHLHAKNTATAIQFIARFLHHKLTSRILSLVQRNMSTHWGAFVDELEQLAANSLILRSLKHLSPESFFPLNLKSNWPMSCEPNNNKNNKKNMKLSSMLAASASASAVQSHNDSSLWLPIDLILEDAMDAHHVMAATIELLTGLVKALQAINGTAWHNTFLGLWIAALRLVQRERDPSEGPVPRLDTCLCMLLCITTLVVTNLIEEEEGELIEEAERSPTNQRKDKPAMGKRRGELVTSLQLLGDYQDLLNPPQPVIWVANQAAAKAIMFVSGHSGYLEYMNVNDLPTNCSGNLWHLIIEACIARHLIDTSAYFWPGYVGAPCNQLPRSIPNHLPSWSSLMQGSPLTPPLVNALVATPASSLAEIEKIFEFAINGSDEEKISAATVLCGASLVRGWNVQEHVVFFIIKLLSPPVPTKYSGTENHLISYAPFLNVLLVGISPVDSVHIFSLHGAVPILAAALMPICEAFGSCVPSVSWTSATGEKLSYHAVFSNAFVLLLRLWRFNHPPVEHVMGGAATPALGLQLGPEYLLLVRNSLFASFGKSPRDRIKSRRISKMISFSSEPVFMDSFPKLSTWYQQHQECLASTQCALVPGGSVLQIVDALLSMMCKKINKSAQSLTSTTSGNSNSSGSSLDDALVKLKVPAWDILEAAPFVLDAALTACAHGRLSPRELATGLKDIADFLPASLATIVSYLSAEVTRGVWKPAFMNGTDWPSPAANLSIVEQQIKKILAATGVDVPSLAIDGNAPATLPLPLAAFLSLTITYKLDKSSERFLVLIGPSLINLSAGCPWPCMPIVGSLWAQKVKRWSDFFVFSASGTVFHHSRDAVVQLLKSCFMSTLGLGSSCIYNNGGVGALLGHGFGSHFLGGISPVAPGILYLRVYRSIRDAMFLTEEIVSLLMLLVRDIASGGLPNGEAHKLKKTKYGMRYGQVSLAASMTRVKHAALLGASFLWISGGTSLIQSLITETLPSWFLSAQGVEQEAGESGVVVAILRGYALACFAVLSGTFAWGIDSSSTASKRRPKVIGIHLEFLANALDGKISLRCDCATWRAYVSGFMSLMVSCTPLWIEELDVGMLKRVSMGLRQLNEDDLALQLLEIRGASLMGEVAEMISQNGF